MGGTATSTKRGTLRKFVDDHLEWDEKWEDKRKHIWRWTEVYRTDTESQLKADGKRVHNTIGHARAGPRQRKWSQRCRRRGTQGAQHKLPYVRQQLYEWFIAMRYAIDWKALNAQLRSRGRHKAIGRFPRSLLRTKFHQLQADYCHHCLVNGVKVKALRQRKQRPNGGVPTAQWFKTWGRGIWCKRSKAKPEV